MKRDQFLLIVALIFLMWGGLADSTGLTIVGFLYLGAVFLEPVVKAAVIFWLKRRRA